jgi:hypothetical protein
MLAERSRQVGRRDRGEPETARIRQLTFEVANCDLKLHEFSGITDCDLEDLARSGQALDVTTHLSGKVAPIPVERIEHTILRLRGHNAMLDADLADMYRVATRDLVRAVGRNRDRFPADFMFRLTRGEFEILRSHRGTSSSWGGRRYLPYAFTEQGVAMLSSVLRSPRAVRVNIEIMRAFVRLRQMLQSNVELAKKLDALEMKYDAQFKVVFQAIRGLMAPPPSARKHIGFQPEKS